MGYAKAMVRFAPADVLRRRNSRRRSARRGAGRRARRRSRRRAAPRFAPTNPLLEQAFPSWARPPNGPAVGADAGSRRLSSPAPASLCWIKFFASIRRSPARCASAWPCAPPTACAALARHREDASALRDAEHLALTSGRRDQPRRAHPSAVAPVRVAAQRGSTRRRCESPPIFLDLPDATSFEGSPTPCGTSWPAPKHPLAAAAGASAAAMKLFARRAAASTPRFSRSGCRISPWRDDSAGTRRFRCSATAIAHPSSRRGASRQASASGRCGLGARAGRRLCAGRPGGFRPGRRAVAPIANAVGGGAQIAGQGRRAGRRIVAWRRRRVAGARRESGASLRSRRASLVRSADRARRRARTLWPAEFSALWTVAFSRKSVRRKRVKKGM